MDKTQLRDIIKEVLLSIGLHSDSAVNLIMGTIAQESAMGKYIKQLGNGPALGICQMEPATHNDIWINYLRYKPVLAAKIKMYALDKGKYSSTTYPSSSQLTGNLYYAIAMCRVHYLRVSERLPDATNVAGHAAYWKKYYNTHLGKGTEQEFITNWQRYVE